MAKKTTKKDVEKKVSDITNYKITKPKSVIYRKNLSDYWKSVYEAKGYIVEVVE